MDNVEVNLLNVINQDGRGDTFDFSIRDTSEFIFITRKVGTISGNTFHEGKSEKTNPKTFVLLSGRITLRFRHVDDKQHTILQIDKPSVIKVKPYVTHSVEAMTDICMLECNAIKDIQNDRYRLAVINEPVTP